LGNSLPLNRLVVALTGAPLGLVAVPRTPGGGLEPFPEGADKARDAPVRRQQGDPPGPRGPEGHRRPTLRAPQLLAGHRPPMTAKKEREADGGEMSRHLSDQCRHPHKKTAFI